MNVEGVEPMYSVLDGEQRLRLRDDAAPGAALEMTPAVAVAPLRPWPDHKNRLDLWWQSQGDLRCCSECPSALR